MKKLLCFIDGMVKGSLFVHGVYCIICGIKLKLTFISIIGLVVILCLLISLLKEIRYNEEK